MTLRDGTLWDSPSHYGTISRVLHWAMAALFAWQFGGMVLKEVIGRTPLTGFWVGSHASVGALLLVLLLVRACWAFLQIGRRPSYREGLIGRLAALGHLGLYGLMFVIPVLALLRMAGSGRGVSLFGVQIQPPGAAKVEWMMAPADLLHGTLAWLLLALIAGHIAMVFVHRWLWRDDVLVRMAGRRAAS